jgi:hypothetical protein
MAGGVDDARTSCGECADGQLRKDCAMDKQRLELLTTCSLCLRVRRDKEWLEAERVIRETRSYEFDTPPRLRGAVCDDCAESIFSRRAEDEEPVAA